MSILLAGINSQYIHSNPALFALLRAGERAGIVENLHIADYSINMPMLRVMEDIYLKAPDVLGFSVYIWNIAFIRELVASLRLLLPKTQIIMGGPEASARALYYLQELPIDGIFIGEGEEAFAAFLKARDKGELCPPLPGWIWKGKEEEYIPAPKPDFAMLPFPYGQQDIEHFHKHNKVIYYESSRGCPYACAFCASATEPLRERPLSLVMEELPLLAASLGQVKFVDRTFNADSHRAIAITKKVLELYAPGLSWHFEISPFGLSRELVDLWLSAPADYLKLEMGVQSLNPAALAAINRGGGSWEKAEPLVKELLANDNCHLHLDLIAGLPKDTPDGFAASFHRLHQLNAGYLQFGFLKVLPGSVLGAKATELGLVFEPQTPYRILATPNMPAEYLFSLNRAERMFNALYNKGEFRPTLIEAAEKYKGGALEMYFRAATLHPSLHGLSQQQKIELVKILSNICECL